MLKIEYIYTCYMKDFINNIIHITNINMDTITIKLITILLQFNGHYPVNNEKTDHINALETKDIITKDKTIECGMSICCVICELYKHVLAFFKKDIFFKKYFDIPTDGVLDRNMLISTMIPNSNNDSGICIKYIKNIIAYKIKETISFPTNNMGYWTICFTKTNEIPKEIIKELWIDKNSIPKEINQDIYAIFIGNVDSKYSFALCYLEDIYKELDKHYFEDLSKKNNSIGNDSLLKIYELHKKMGNHFEIDNKIKIRKLFDFPENNEWEMLSLKLMNIMGGQLINGCYT